MIYIYLSSSVVSYREGETHQLLLPRRGFVSSLSFALFRRRVEECVLNGRGRRVIDELVEAVCLADSVERWQKGLFFFY